jgi:hypothetical protein
MGEPEPGPGKPISPTKPKHVDPPVPNGNGQLQRNGNGTPPRNLGIAVKREAFDASGITKFITYPDPDEDPEPEEDESSESAAETTEEDPLELDEEKEYETERPNPNVQDSQNHNGSQRFEIPSTTTTTKLEQDPDIEAPESLKSTEEPEAEKGITSGSGSHGSLSMPPPRLLAKPEEIELQRAEMEEEAIRRALAGNPDFVYPILYFSGRTKEMPSYKCLKCPTAVRIRSPSPPRM